MKKNCWEFKNCGRQPGGEHIHDLGVCPAVMETKLDGVHGGKNSGRTCWVVAGTYCGGKVQGTFGQKYSNCKLCDFYRTVKTEENSGFKLSPTLLSILNG